MTQGSVREAEELTSDDISRRRFARLLERLRAHSDAHGFGYEQLRRRLILFFRPHEPAHAEDLADETLDRLARRLDEGTEIEQPALYAFGIAKLILLEARARRTRQDALINDPTFSDSEEASAMVDPALLSALRACMTRLGDDGAALIQAYYRDDSAGRIAVRRQLAEQLGISANSLRNRALRLRALLENCLRKRLGEPMPTARRDGIALVDTTGNE